MILLVALVGVVAIVSLSFLNWRRAVKTVLFVVVLEGVLRKWVLPQASDMIYFLKDLILLGAYLRYYLSPEPKYPLKLTFFNIALLMSLGWCIFQVVNPNLGSLIVGIFGLKAYLFYVPLMWMLPSLFDSEEELYKFLRAYLLLLIPVSILAIAQFYSPASSPINVYGGGVEANAVVDGNPRVTGTFPYIAGYSTYLSICWTILIPLMSLPHKKIWSFLTLVEILLIVGTSFMTGARGLLLFEILFTLGYFCLLWLTKPSKAFNATKQFVVPILLISTVVPLFFDKAIQAFSKRATTASDSSTFVDRVFSSLPLLSKRCNTKDLIVMALEQLIRLSLLYVKL